MINLLDLKYHPGVKRSKHPAKRYKLKYFLRWIKKDPIKFVAYIAAVVLVYVTFLFIQFSKEQHTSQNFNIIQQSVISIKH